MTALSTETDAWITAALLAVGMLAGWTAGWWRGRFVARESREVPESQINDAIVGILGNVTGYFGAHFMTTLRKQLVSIFVDRSSRQWIVLDPEGTFWVVPPIEDGWQHRQPFTPEDDGELEPVPRHYKYMLGLPF